MDFILPFALSPTDYSFGYKNKTVCLGSCFAQEIGELLHDYKFNLLLNPHGILFNSESILRALNDYKENRQYNSNDLVFENNLWHSPHHHGSFSNADQAICLTSINTAITATHIYLQSAHWLFITLGTSWAFRNLNTDEIVANCHKMAQKNFKKEMLDSAQQITAWQAGIKKLKAFNSNLKILFTVSPVRYIRDGVVENNLSKAQLLTTVHSLCKHNPECHYFPAYELVIDVLRDYRFFKEDLVHPNKQAIKFVWEQFINNTLGSNDRVLFEEIGAYLKLVHHRPLHKSDSLVLNQKMEAMYSMILEKLGNDAAKEMPKFVQE
ncbi:MAG: GSCFA domain-containing protein [Bacteroidetes bacterium]|nr:GSCFA domain-containing protein [Bacteroidota bacterium]